MRLSSSAATGDVARPGARGTGSRAAGQPPLIALLLTSVAALGIFLLSPNTPSADSLRTTTTAWSMLTDGDIRLENNIPAWAASDFALLRRDGHSLPFFPFTVSLFAVPVLAAHALLLLPSGGSPAQVMSRPDGLWAYELVTASVVSAGAVGVLGLLAWTRLDVLSPGRRRRAAVGAAGVAALGSSLWSVASRSLWQHGPSVLLSASALLAATYLARTGGRRAAVACGAAAAGSFAVRPTEAVLVLALGGWIWLRQRPALPWAALGASPVTVLLVAVGLLEYDQPLPDYYVPGQVGSRFDVAPVAAILGNLVSPSRGLLVFSPWVLLAGAGITCVARRRDQDGLLAVAFVVVVGHLAVLASFGHWWGGASYGPRLTSDLLPVVVLLCLPAVAFLAAGGARVRLARAVSAVLVGLAVVAHGQGAVLASTWCWNAKRDVDRNPGVLWDWRDPQITSGLRAVLAGSLPQDAGRAAVVREGCQPPAAAP